jgi:hypothetical protein
MPPRLLDRRASACYLGGISRKTIRGLDVAGILNRVRIPSAGGGELRRVLYDRVDLDALIRQWKERPSRGAPANAPETMLRAELSEAEQATDSPYDPVVSLRIDALRRALEALRGGRP